MKYGKFFICILIFALLAQTPAHAIPIFREKPPEEAKVPIIMYHLVTKSSKYHGKYAISPEEFENDLKYLKDNGYETIVISDLIRFVDRKEPLPENPVILTFDDGSSGDYYYVYPLLEKYDMKAVMSIIGKLADDYSNDGKTNKKPHMIWEQIEELHKSKRGEIQNHSYDLHGSSGSGKRSGEPDEAYRERLKADLTKAQDRINEEINYKPTTFTYPLGVISKGSEEVLKELGFKASLSCAEGMNIIKQDDPECLFRLKRTIRPSGRSVGEVLKKIENSK